MSLHCWLSKGLKLPWFCSCHYVLGLRSGMQEPQVAVSCLFPWVHCCAHGGLALLSLWQSMKVLITQLCFGSIRGTWRSWTGCCLPSISNIVFFGISSQFLHWKGLGLSWCSQKKAGVHSNCYWQAVLSCRICLTWVMAAALSLLWSIWQKP